MIVGLRNGLDGRLPAPGARPGDPDIRALCPATSLCHSIATAAVAGCLSDCHSLVAWNRWAGLNANRRRRDIGAYTASVTDGVLWWQDASFPDSLRPRSLGPDASLRVAARSRQPHLVESSHVGPECRVGGNPAVCRVPSFRSSRGGRARTEVPADCPGLGSAFRRRRLSLLFGVRFGSEGSARGRVDALMAIVPADAIPRRGIAAQHFLDETGAG